MTVAVPLTVNPPTFSEVIERLGHGEARKLSIGDIVYAFGDRAFGAVMLLVAIINMLPWPPGGTTLTGAPLVLLSLELAVGREHLWLPKWTMAVSVDRAAYRKLSGRFLPVIRSIERLSRPRLYPLTSALSQAVIGLTCLLLSVVLVLPIPLGNIAPAFAIAFFSLGIMQRDGLAVILGWLFTALSVALLALVWTTVWLAAQAILGRLF